MFGKEAGHAGEDFVASLQEGAVPVLEKAERSMFRAAITAGSGAGASSGAEPDGEGTGNMSSMPKGEKPSALYWPKA